MTNGNVRRFGLRARGRIRVAVEDRGYRTPCWIWTQADFTDDYYGRYLVAGTNTSAHRAFYQAKHGPIPEGLALDHLCRVPACVNPAHLEPVTITENTRRGSHTKLTAAQAGEIKAMRQHLLRGRTRLQRGQREAIAAQYGVTPRNISAIWRGESWA